MNGIISPRRNKKMFTIVCELNLCHPCARWGFDVIHNSFEVSLITEVNTTVERPYGCQVWVTWGEIQGADWLMLPVFSYF